MNLIAIQEELMGFLEDPENAQRLNGLVEDIRCAFMDYQVCTPHRLTLNTSDIFLRLRCSKKSMTKAVS